MLIGVANPTDVRTFYSFEYAAMFLIFGFAGHQAFRLAGQKELFGGKG
jgi:hypothetical protein